MRTILFYAYIAYSIVVNYPRIIMIKRKMAQAKITENELYSQWDVFGSNFTKNLIQIAGIDLQVKGIENIKEGPYLFVGNHQGNIDIPLLYFASPIKMAFIAKKELTKIPLFSKIADARGNIFMDRENVRESIKSINNGIELLKRGHSLALFPEGKRSKSQTINEFKPGGLRLAIKSGADIIPFVFSGSYKVMEESGGKIKPTKVTITFLEPIKGGNFSDATELSVHLHEIISNKIMVED